MTTKAVESLKGVVGSGALATYLREMAKSGLLLDIPGNTAALEKLYGTKGPLAALSSIPHSPVPGILQTREATINSLRGKGFRTNTNLETLKDLASEALPEKLKSILGIPSISPLHKAIGNLSVVLDTAASAVPILGDMARPSKFLEAKALYGNPLYNLVPMYSAHTHLALPKANDKLLRHVASGGELSKSDALVLKLLTTRNRN